MRRKTRTPTEQPRRDQFQREHMHDPYQSREKLTEPMVCGQCGAVFHDGHWQWGPAPRDAQQSTCPACHRINDSYPAGELTLAGDFINAHRDEILALARHQEELEKGEHALHRIMDISTEPEGMSITTTDIHLPRRIGEAVHRAFHGDLDIRYVDDTYFVRVDWRRDA